MDNRCINAHKKHHINGKQHLWMICNIIHAQDTQRKAYVSHDAKHVIKNMLLRRLL